ncbi:rhodopsin [Trichoplax sp. H2]|nr:rhodopsin [Trichoplax sp. H2]|eukprot:RDD45697.1 rhodopsin [Trichoplax sp. H2]
MENLTSWNDSYDNINIIHNSSQFLYQLVAIFYLPLEIIGLFSNLYLIMIIISHKDMRSPAYICIGNLAVANVFLTISFTFLTWGRYGATLNLTNIFHQRFFQIFICKLVVPTLVTAFMISNLSVVLITYERYKAIATSAVEKLKRIHVLLIIIAIWLVSVLMIWPRTITSGPFPPIESLCGLIATRFTVKLLVISTAALIYILQLVTILHCYPRILHKLKNRSLTPMKMQQLRLRLRQQRLSRVEQFRIGKNKSIVHMFQITFSLQVLSDTMCFFILVSIILFNERMSILAISIMFAFLCLFMLAVAIYHPIIYITHMKKFKDPLCSVFGHCCSSKRFGNKISPIFANDIQNPYHHQRTKTLNL